MHKLKSEARLKNMAWAAVVLLLIGVLLYEWQQIEHKAEDLQLRLTKKNIYQGAVNLKQQWELNNKPLRDHIDGIDFQYTQLGWPIVIVNKRLNCDKLWRLLTSNDISYKSHNKLLYVMHGQLVDNNRCVYMINNKPLAIIYFGGKINVMI